MSQPWTPPPSGGVPGSVPNYLVVAILSAFCCTPLGIAAIIFSTQVNNKVAAGDMAGALDASKKAKMFSFLSIGLWLVLVLIYIIFMVLVGGLSVLGNM